MLAGGGVVAGIAGGILLGHRLVPQRRKVLGVRLGKGAFTGHGFDLKPTAKQVSNAGKRMTSVSGQLIRFGDDLQSVGRAAQRVGDSFS